jgi:hypothetical protein
MCAMAAVISAGIVEGAARAGAFPAGRALLDAGAVTELESFDGGASALVADDDGTHDAWAGIRYQFLVGECDCADAEPVATSDEYLQAAADDEVDPPELCAHAVAVALAAIEDGLPWASAPADHRPLYLRVAGLRITTPPPLFDITTVFPELAALAATTVRLHPRIGRPEVTDSSIGGPLLWPAGEAWPGCDTLHSGVKEVPLPPEITTWDEARAWGRTNRASVHLDHRTGRMTARVSAPRPADARPLVGVLQVYARDVPELPFPDGTDLFQLLWCPNAHEAPWYGPKPVTFWRKAADVTVMLADPPEPVFDPGMDEADFDPVPCLVHPERVTEYPDADDLPGELRERVREWDQVADNDAPHLYWSSLSTAPGTKLLGHPRWYQGPRWPACECGRRMRHLATISSEELRAGRWLPDDDGEDPPSAFPRNYAPHGILIGDVGDMYLFTCDACPDRPLRIDIQSG